MLKRQMYGRAGIELLRARLLPEPALRKGCLALIGYPGSRSASRARPGAGG
jgi:hypothetical protein